MKDLREQIIGILIDKLEMSLTGNYKSAYIDGLEPAADEILALPLYSEEFLLWIRLNANEIHYRFIDNAWMWIRTDTTTITQYNNLRELYDYWKLNIQDK